MNSATQHASIFLFEGAIQRTRAPDVEQNSDLLSAYLVENHKLLYFSGAWNA